jgi:hypothetical protein
MLFAGRIPLRAAPIPDSRLFGDPPGEEPKLFGAGFISLDGRHEYGLSLSPDGKELFFTAEKGPAGVPSGLLVMRKSPDGTWSYPEAVDLRKQRRWEFEAFHAPDGRSLVFAGDDEQGKTRLYLARRTGGGWGEPAQIAGPVNASEAFWPSLARDGTLYFTDIRKAMIFFAPLKNGAYLACERIGFARGIIHPSIAPDGSFLLCNSDRDVLVAFRSASGGWDFPRSLGPKINTAQYDEGCASLSPDGKFIFFSRYNGTGGKADIYWVSSSVVNALRPKG